MGIHQSIATEAGQRAHYAAIRAKLFGKPSKPANVNIAKPVIEVARVEPPKTKVRYIDPIPAPRKPQNRIAQNMWEKANLTFNQHVVDFRAYLLRQEQEASGDVSDVAPPPARKPIIDIVLSVLERYPGVTVDELKGRHRKQKFVRPRQVAMYEIYMQRKDFSFPRIGQWFERDHTTVLHAVRKIEAERASTAQEAAE